MTQKTVNVFVLRILQIMAFVQAKSHLTMRAQAFGVELVINIILYSSLIFIQLPKLHFIPLYWDNYTPMMEVGEYLNMQPIQFSASWWNTWRGVWIYVHLLSCITIFALLLRRERKALFFNAHWFFCGWMMLNVIQFGTAPWYVAVPINIIFVLLINIFAFIWPSEIMYKIFLGMPSLLEMIVFVPLMIGLIE